MTSKENELIWEAYGDDPNYENGREENISGKMHPGKNSINIFISEDNEVIIEQSHEISEGNRDSSEESPPLRHATKKACINEAVIWAIAHAGEEALKRYDEVMGFYADIDSNLPPNGQFKTTEWNVEYDKNLLIEW